MDWTAGGPVGCWAAVVDGFDATLDDDGAAGRLSSEASSFRGGTSFPFRSLDEEDRTLSFFLSLSPVFLDDSSFDSLRSR